MFKTLGLRTTFIILTSLAALAFNSTSATAQDRLPKQAAQGTQEEPAVDYTPFEWRVWTDATGQTTYGQFERIVDKQDVSIFDRTGEQITIPIHSLTAPDIFEAFQSSIAYGPQVQKEELAIINDDSDLRVREARGAEQLRKLGAPPEIRKIIADNLRARKAAAANTGTAKAETGAANDSELEAFEAAQQARLDLMRQWDQSRTWTDVSGRYTVEGTFLQIVDRRKVVLLTTEGKKNAISLAKLSVDDIYVAIHGELNRPDGTAPRSVQFSSDWIPGENKN